MRITIWRGINYQPMPAEGKTRGPENQTVVRAVIYCNHATKLQTRSKSVSPYHSLGFFPKLNHETRCSIFSLTNFKIVKRKVTSNHMMMTMLSIGRSHDLGLQYRMD
jgi:hypothetical protein